MIMPKLKTFKIPEVIPESYGTMFDFKGQYTDASGVAHNVTVFNTSYFIDHILLYHYNRKITLPESNPEAVFHELFLNWVESRKELYFKQAYAYQLKYNPIENYSSTEQLIDDITEHEKGASHKVDYHNTDTDTLTPFTKITDETTPYTKETTETTPYTKETTETTPYTKETTETTPYTKETTETTPYTKETSETTPYTSETKTTTAAGQNVPANSTTNSRMAFNSNAWANTEKSESDINTQEQLVKAGKETVENWKTGTEKVELSKTGTEKVELTKTGTEKTEFSKTGTEKVELTKTGTEKTERTYSGTEEHEIEHTGYVETTTDGTDTDTRNYTLKKAGNIGVMTPAEMLQKEFDGLSQDLAQRAFMEFIDRYTWYSIEID